jgi:large subunit ribosomal protein L22
MKPTAPSSKVRAKLSNFGVPPLKVRRFAGTIKGEQVAKALGILAMQSSPTCQTLHKLLSSAIANAENNNGLAAENLIVSNVLVDQGPTMKRIRPRARGRAYRILKRSSHVTIELDLKPGLTLEALKAAEADKAGSRAKRKAGSAEQAPAAKAAAPKRSSKAAKEGKE